MYTAIIEFVTVNSAALTVQQKPKPYMPHPLRRWTHLVCGWLLNEKARAMMPSSLNEATHLVSKGRNNIVLEAGMKIGETLMGADSYHKPVTRSVRLHRWHNEVRQCRAQYVHCSLRHMVDSRI